MIAPHNPSSPSGPGVQLAVVRYSLPAMIAEVQLERRAPAFAGEKLDQVEIAKLFNKPRARRGLKNRQ
ncbi:MAG TPA: hypothetical protein VHD32_11220 [Candidatus Didemnitutus sp.]|nr:hypothetical protein [Candidatus Didemnitutus sp.]